MEDIQELCIQITFSLNSFSVMLNYLNERKQRFLKIKNNMGKEIVSCVPTQIDCVLTIKYKKPLLLKSESL